MKQQMCKITIQGTEREYPRETTFQQIADEYQSQMENDIVLVKFQQDLRELHQSVLRDGELEFITTAEKPGRDTYRRSVTLLMEAAAWKLYPNLELLVQHSIGQGYYCEFRHEDAICVPDQKMLQALKEKMQAFVEADLPIVKYNMSTQDASARFRQMGRMDKVRLMRYRRSSRVNVYELQEFPDYYYGYMVPDASYLSCFDLKLFEDGFVLQFPPKGQPQTVPEFRPEMKIYHVQRDSMEWGSRLGIPTVGALNDFIVQHTAKELIMIQEAFHEKKIAEIAAQIAAKPEQKIVLIAGPSSSGKTTFSHRLSTQLSVYGLKPHPIAADDYFVDREKTPRDADGKYDFERIEAIDAVQLNADMTALLNGETVELPTFNFKTGRRDYKGRTKTLGKDDILIIEGIHCLNDALTVSLPRENKFKIYISALTQLNIDEHNRIPTTDGRLLRRIVRDARTRGASAKDTIAMWDSVRRGEERNIFPYQESADVMFNSALIYELAVLKLYAEPQLFSISPEEPEYEEAKRLLKFLDYFLPVPGDDIPNNSLIREFIGGGCFDL